MGKDSITVTGVYEHLDSFLAALKELQGSGYADFTVYSPLPHHEIEEALDEPESKVGFFALGGGILGWLAGLALTVGTALYLPLIVGGKPIVSFVPFYVIGFELTILLGGLFTLLSFLLLAKLPRTLRKESFNPRFTEDRFGVTVRCPREVIREVEKILRNNYAEEVSVE
jgi:molybdopterin-containing oxidoreductase family membrane subunit